jgi:hypothetical protein
MQFAEVYIISLVYSNSNSIISLDADVHGRPQAWVPPLKCAKYRSIRRERAEGEERVEVPSSGNNAAGTPMSMFIPRLSKLTEAHSLMQLTVRDASLFLPYSSHLHDVAPIEL